AGLSGSGMVAPGQLDRGLVGLGAAVAKKDPVEAGHLRQPVGQLRLRRDVVEIGGVKERVRRRPDGRLQPGMAVTQGGDSEAADEVQVRPAGHVVEPGAFSPGEGQREPAVGVHHRPVGHLEDAVGFGTRIQRSYLLHGTTMVPMPWSVKISRSSECILRPSMMCVRATPPSRARMHASTLGIIPPAIWPSWIMRCACSVRSEEMSVVRSSGSAKIPSTSVSMMSLSALSAAAKCPATASALML